MLTLKLKGGRIYLRFPLAHDVAELPSSSELITELGCIRNYSILRRIYDLVGQVGLEPTTTEL